MILFVPFEAMGSSLAPLRRWARRGERFPFGQPRRHTTAGRRGDAGKTAAVARAHAAERVPRKTTVGPPDLTDGGGPTEYRLTGGANVNHRHHRHSRCADLGHQPRRRAPPGHRCSSQPPGCRGRRPLGTTGDPRSLGSSALRRLGSRGAALSATSAPPTTLLCGLSDSAWSRTRLRVAGQSGMQVLVVHLPVAVPVGLAQGPLEPEAGTFGDDA